MLNRWLFSVEKNQFILSDEIVVKEIFIQKSEALNWFKIAEKIKRQKLMKYLSSLCKAKE